MRVGPGSRDGAQFVEALRRVAAGGTALDPEVVRQLLVRRRAIDDLNPRERQMLELMAEGRTNAAIARRLVVTDRAVEKHVASIFGKLRLPPSQEATGASSGRARLDQLGVEAQSITSGC